MKGKGFDIDAFNLQYQFFHSKRNLPLLIKIISLLPKNRVMMYLVRNFLFRIIINIVQKDFDVLDIHYFSKYYVDLLNKTSKPFKITVWGSDFYREIPKWLERKRDVYKKAKVIQVETITVEKDLIEYEPTLIGKVRVCNFGVDILDEIDFCSRKEDNNLIARKDNQIVLTCGYNGSISQQHLKIFEQIGRLNNDIKKRILVCVPVTYGLTMAYEKQIRQVLNDIKVEYCLIKDRLSELDLAKLRVESDIVINIQTTDSLSSSLLQHLYAGSILLLGKWLPTETYDSYGLYYHVVETETIANQLEVVISDLQTEKYSCKQNHDIVKSFATWESVGNKQKEIYKEIFIR